MGPSRDDPGPVAEPPPGLRSYAEQLRDTIAFAVERIPYYRDRAEQYAGPIESPADLARLPILERSAVLEDPRAFASGTDEWPASITWSSSTTGGIGQPRWRSRAEQEVLVEHLAALDRARDPGGTSDDGPAGATLVIHPFDQGPPTVPAGAARRVYVPMLVPWHFDHIHDLLRDGFQTPAGPVPITALDCFSPGLRILTEWFAQRDLDPAAFGVRQLFGYGSIQPGPWRRRLEAAWGARYTDLYGLSEVVVSDSAECPLCHAYHFPLPIVPEVVDPVTRLPIGRGTGVLLLTELHPFAQLQLLLRYWTDDLVELARPCPIGGFGIFLRGRRSSSLVIERADGPPLVVGGLQVGESASEVADVANGDVPWAAWARDVGAPRFTLTADLSASPRVVEVRVELRYDPALHPPRAADAVAEVEARVRGAVTGLAAAIDDGLVELRVVAVAPGRLDEPTKV